MMNIRPMTEADLPFILSTWLRNYRHSATGFTQAIDKDIYYEFHHLVISRILSRSGARILLAVDRQDPKVIFGYLVWEPLPESDVVHYGYVKKAFRNMGVFKTLLGEAKIRPNKIFYTHQTELGKKLVEKEREGWECRYHPYLI